MMLPTVSAQVVSQSDASPQSQRSEQIAAWGPISHGGLHVGCVTRCALRLGAGRRTRRRSVGHVTVTAGRTQCALALGFSKFGPSESEPDSQLWTWRSTHTDTQQRERETETETETDRDRDRDRDE